MTVQMKKALSFFIIMIIVLSSKAFADTYYYDNAWKTHSENVSLYINCEAVNSDVPPLIIAGRTMVPARAFFERLGARVEWNPAASEITVLKNDFNISLTVNSSAAVVNGKTVQLDVPAKIITDVNGIARTMIPVRFVSSCLGYEVTWDENMKAVGVNTPQEKQAPQVTFIGTSCTADTDLIEVYTSVKCEPKISKLSNPDRLVLDFYGLSLKSGDASLGYGGACYTNIRYANHTNEYARVVIDIAMPYSYTVKSDNDKCSISLLKTGEGNVQAPAASEPATPKPTQTAAPAVSPAEIGKYLVVIDPGHGGSDPGAIGKLDGQNVYESTANLDISLKVKSILQNNGISVTMTRTDDTFVGLTERAQYANTLKSALFICIHNNSAVIDTAHGSMVYYYTGATDSKTKVAYGITSKEVAQLVKSGVIASAGRYDRGIDDGSKFVVLHKTVMPAILVECAFLSNEEECRLLTTNDFRQRLAQGIADGIIEALRKMGKI